MRIINRVIVSLVLLLGAGLQGWSQTNNTLFFMNGVPQSNRINPARQPECGFYFGIPLLSPTTIHTSSSSLAFGDVIYPHPTEDSLITFLHPLGDQQAFLNKLKPLNLMLSDMGVSLISFGFRTGAGFFTLDVSSRVEGNIYFPGDLPRLVLEGADEGETYTMDGMGTDITGFDEIAVGWSGAIGNRWQIGVRGKAYFGLANLSTTHSEFSVTTSEEVWNIHSDMEFDASLPFADVIYNEDGMIEDIIIDEELRNMSPMAFARQAFSSKNFGLGIDLGVDYRPSDQWLLSASLLDLGYIRWTDEVHEVSFKTDYDYTGLEVNPLEFSGERTFSEYLDSSLTALADTLAGELEFTPGKIYSRRLSTKVFIGASWYVTPNINFGLLSRTDFLKETIIEEVTASANFAAGRVLNFTLSYSYINGYLKNFGAGISFNTGPVNLYVISDNALNALFWPHEAKSANIWFGMNLVFGYQQFSKLDRDRPLVY
ncbi:MAG: hypothetical protein KAS82_06280 [Bacteroidales bacterium]|nr:hypothetical protein [Bacteroidales bacterium]